MKEKMPYHARPVLIAISAAAMFAAAEIAWTLRRREA